MIIECDSCKSRFRLDRKLIDGYRAVRVRCRTCGGPIIVMVSQPPSAAPPPYRDERRRGTHAIPSAATARPLVEEEPVAEATPGNLVDLRRFRGSYRKRILAGAYDISESISTEIPYPELPFAAAGPEARGNEATTELAPPDAEQRIAPAMVPVPPELPFAAEGPEARGNEATTELAPPDAEQRIAPVMAPVPPVFAPAMPPVAPVISPALAPAAPVSARAMAPVPPVLESISQREEPTRINSKILEESFLLKEGHRSRRSTGLSVLRVMILVTALGMAIGYMGYYLLFPVIAWTLK